MKFALIAFIHLLIVQFGFSQVGKVGINTTSPAAMLHVKDSSVLFTGLYPLTTRGNPPATGAGTRLMWYPDKAAFRAGQVSINSWNKDSIGLYSIAGGSNTTAFGGASTAFGSNAKALGIASFAVGQASMSTGGYSFTGGINCIASGLASVSIGNMNDASGNFSLATGNLSEATGLRSIAMGYQCLATGTSAIAIGSSNNARGEYSMSTGVLTTARAYASFVAGRYNDTTASTTNSWVETEPLFVIGNGASNFSRSNALTILKNGNVGLGVKNPGFLLNFSNTDGDKISLSGTSGDHYGFGILPNKLLIHTDNNFADILFGHGSSSSFTERMRITGNGNVGIGTFAPGFPLNFANSLGDKISLFGISGAHYGFGIQNNLLQIHADVMGSDIAFGYGSSAGFVENMRIKGNGNVGIANNNPGFKLDISGRMRLRHSGDGSPGTWYNKADNSAAISFIGLFNDNHVGIYSEIGASWNFLMNLTNGNIGIGISPTQKLHVSGNGLFTGTVTANCGVLICSDMRYKTNIQTLTNSLSHVLALRGISYNWDTEHFPEKQFNDQRQIGFAAQELEKIIPDMVHTDEAGFKTVDYSRLTPVLVEAIKEQQLIIENQDNKLDLLQEQVEMLIIELNHLKKIYGENGNR